MVGLAVLIFCWIQLSSAANLLQNGGFESLNNWQCYGFHCELTSDHHSGSHAIKATGRHQYYQGPQQNINCVQNGKYSVQAFVKLYQNGHGKFSSSQVKITAHVQFSDGSQEAYLPAAEEPLVWKGYWLEMNGDFKVPNHPVRTCTVYIEGPAGGIDFALDDFNVQKLNDDPHWKDKANANIFSSSRQTNLHVHLTSEHLDPSQVDVELIQLKHEFAFGSAVSAHEITYGDSRYKDFVFKYFNWATLENALKWDFMERTRHQIDYNTPMTAINILRGKGLKIRAHCIIWSVDQFEPTWLKSLSGQQVKDAVTTRINGVVPHFKGHVEHWDVNNENLHGFFFQDKTGDFDYPKNVFKQVHNIAGNIKLFANDYDVVAAGYLTGAYLNQVQSIIRAGGGIGGIGVQAHFHPNEAPDPILIKKRLDTLAKAGLDIWITELDVTTSDDNTRADWYEIALRSFYGHPAVKGIMLWGFWGKRHWRCDAGSLVSAGNCHASSNFQCGGSCNDFRINAAGNRYIDLVWNQWKTYKKQKLSQGNINTHAFRGDYMLKFTYQGRELTGSNKYFHVTGNSQTVTAHVKP